MEEKPLPSAYSLHGHWARLEDEHHELAIAIEEARIGGAHLALMREQQARLLLEINTIVTQIRDAPVTTLKDFAALLDVALEHELDLPGDMAFYGPADYPMTVHLLRALMRMVAGFEFNSLRRWLSSAGQFEPLIGSSTLCEPPRDDHSPAEPIGFGER